MPTGQKHLVKCRCILPQFKAMVHPITHQFSVFSVIDDDENVVPKFVQCPNCGVIHKVVDILNSEIIQGREHMSSILSIEEIKQSIPTRLDAVLESNDADRATWEAVKFAFDNKVWGTTVVITSDLEDGMRQGKYVFIVGENLFKIESFTRSEFVTE